MGPTRLVVASGAFASAAVLLITLALLPAGVSAQGNLEAGFAVSGGFPQGAFAEQVSSGGLGMSGHARFRPGGGSFLVGLDAGFLVYGLDKGAATITGTTADISAELTVSNYLFPIHLAARYQPRRQGLISFVEAVAGLDYFYTRAALQSVRAEGYDPTALSSTTDDATFTVGAGAGVRFRLRGERAAEEEMVEEDRPDPDERFARPPPPRPEGARARELLLELSLHHLWGGRADYMTDAEVVFDGNDFRFDTVRSATPVLLVRVGLTWVF